MQSKPGYNHPVSHTNGFIVDGDPVLYDPSEIHKRKGSGFEPSPLTAGSGYHAYFTLSLNLLLHSVCFLCTAVAAAMYLPPGNDKKNDDYTGGMHSFDYVKSWVITMLVCEVLVVALTLLYFGFVYRAFSTPLIGHIGLSLQLIATSCAGKLSYWIAMAPAVSTKDRDPAGDAWILATFYIGLIVIAGYIMTPISATYYETLKKPNVRLCKKHEIPS